MFYSFPVYVQEKLPPVPLIQHRQHADMTRVPEKIRPSSAATVLLSLKFICIWLFIAVPPFYLMIYSENIGADKYLSPVSGNRATMIFPLFP